MNKRELDAMLAAGLLTPQQAQMLQAAVNGQQQRDEPARTLEDELAAVLGAALAAELATVLDDIEAQREPDYEKLAAALALLLIPLLMRAMVDMMLREAQISGIGVDIALINETALAWSQAYAYDLIHGLTKTTRGAVQEAMAVYLSNPGMTREELAALLAPAFGQQRAKMIAATEITRAYTQGVLAYRRMLARLGIAMRAIYHTQRDERVCPECGPRDGIEIIHGDDAPPLHPNCRCWLELKVRA